MEREGKIFYLKGSISMERFLKREKTCIKILKSKTICTRILISSKICIKNWGKSLKMQKFEKIQHFLLEKPETFQKT